MLVVKCRIHPRILSKTVLSLPIESVVGADT
jgi:hypothetical protein